MAMNERINCFHFGCTMSTHNVGVSVPWYCFRHRAEMDKVNDGTPPVPKKVYIVGSLRNPVVREVAHAIRGRGFDVFDDWHGCGPDADDHWKVYEQSRNRKYSDALRGKLAQHAFSFDKSNLDEADVVVLVLPAGKSGHLELGYAAGKGKRTYILLEPDRDEDRWDLMYLFATAVVTNVKELLEKMNG